MSSAVDAPPPRLMLATAGLTVWLAGDPVDAGDHAGIGAGAVAVEHADGDQLHALGDALGGAADGAGDMRAVAVAVVLPRPSLIAAS